MVELEAVEAASDEDVVDEVRERGSCLKTTSFSISRTSMRLARELTVRLLRVSKW
jgi:hypothetical protein